jgi:hypothetical protein
MKSTRKIRALGLLLGAGILASSHATMADMTYFVNQAGGIDVANRDVDFTTPSVVTISTGNLNGFKSWGIHLSTNSNKSQCFQVWTAGDGTGDTRFWAYDSSINDYRSLNDDSNGTLYSSANVWVVPNNNTYEYSNFIVTGYSQSYNSMKFELIIHRLPTTTTEAQCTQGSTLKQIRGVQTFVNAT